MLQLKRNQLPSQLIPILVFGVMAIVYLYALGNSLSNDDEGTFLYQAWRVAEGDALYRDLYSSRWPLFIYTGAFWIEMFGYSIIPIRIVSLLLTFGTAGFVYAITRKYTGWVEATVAMGAYLFNPIVFENARFYTTEPYYIFFGVWGFYLFLQRYEKASPYALMLPGFIFAISASYKVLGHLIIAGCLAYLGFRWIMEPERRWGLTTRIFVLGLTHAVTYGLAVVLIAFLFPSFTEGVFGANFGSEPTAQFSLFANYQQWLEKIIVYLILNLPVCLLVLIEYFPTRKSNKELGAMGWQIPTAIAFILLSRKLFIRLFVYLNPFMAILFGICLGNLKERGSYYRPAIVVSILMMIGINSIFWPTKLFRLDAETLRITEEIVALTEPGDIVFSDYQEFNYLSQRQSTFQGAEISNVIILNGVISADDVIGEIEENEVYLFLIDRDGQHMMSLPDIEKLDSYISEHFELKERINRFPERELPAYIEIWVRRQSS